MNYTPEQLRGKIGKRFIAINISGCEDPTSKYMLHEVSPNGNAVKVSHRDDGSGIGYPFWRAIGTQIEIVDFLEE